MGRKFSFEVNRTSTASPAALFALEADGPSWAKWGKPLIVQARWKRQGADDPAGVGAVREVGLWPVLIREETLEYEPGQKHVYTFFGANPIKDYRAEVLFTPTDGGGTHLRWTGSFTEPVKGTGPILVAGLERVIRLFSGKLVKAAETGR